MIFLITLAVSTVFVTIALNLWNRTRPPKSAYQLLGEGFVAGFLLDACLFYISGPFYVFAMTFMITSTGVYIFLCKANKEPIFK